MRTAEEMNRMLDWLDERLNEKFDGVDKRLSKVEGQVQDHDDALHDLAFRTEILNEGQHFGVDDEEPES